MRGEVQRVLEQRAQEVQAQQQKVQEQKKAIKARVNAELFAVSPRQEDLLC